MDIEKKHEIDNMSFEDITSFMQNQSLLLENLAHQQVQTPLLKNSFS